MTIFLSFTALFISSFSNATATGTEQLCFWEANPKKGYFPPKNHFCCSFLDRHINLYYCSCLIIIKLFYQLSECKYICLLYFHCQLGHDLIYKPLNKKVERKEGKKEQKAKHKSKEKE